MDAIGIGRAVPLPPDRAYIYAQRLRVNDLQVTTSSHHRLIARSPK